ncbi:methyltransferase [Pyrenophora tritici-repentis]|nr:methyltransferase [Pyrenophora tritici-repentis]
MVDSNRDVAYIFNSAIAAASIGAAWEIGLLDQLRNGNKTDVKEFAAQHDLHYDSIHGLVTALAVVHVVEYDNHTATAGKLFDEVYRSKSIFHWLTLGSGGLLSRMQLGCDLVRFQDISREHFDPAFWLAMDGIDYKIHSVVDLGSGSGERLMEILERYPGTVGLGVDIAKPSTEVARSDAIKRGFGDRLSFVVGDVRALSYRDEFAQVDLLTCFMMGHDFWPRENCIATLQSCVLPFLRSAAFSSVTVLGSY